MTTSFIDLKPLFKRLRMSSVCEHAWELDKDPATAALTHAQWIETLLRAEIVRREDKALKRRIQDAQIRYVDACFSDVDYDPVRCLDKAFIAQLASCDWIRHHQNLIITGKTGCGKTWMASAVTRAACLAGFTARTYRLAHLLAAIKAGETALLEYRKLSKELEQVDLLVLDDWGIGTADRSALAGLYDIIDKRCHCKSTLVVSVLPVRHWAEFLNDATLADSILDRLVKSSHRLEMDGPSMRDKAQYGAIPKIKRD